jgi:hypothetical protein
MTENLINLLATLCILMAILLFAEIVCFIRVNGYKNEMKKFWLDLTKSQRGQPVVIGEPAKLIPFICLDPARQAAVNGILDTRDQHIDAWHDTSFWTQQDWVGAVQGAYGCVLRTNQKGTEAEFREYIEELAAVCLGYLESHKVSPPSDKLCDSSVPDTK